MFSITVASIKQKISAWLEKRTIITAARRGDYDLLCERAEAALNESIWQNGPDHPETARMLAALAAVYGMQEDAAAAVPLLRRAVAILERSDAPDGQPYHPLLAEYWDELANALMALPEPAEAERARRTALRLREETFGDEHPEVAESLDNLALTLKGRGRYAEAKGLHRRALLIWEATRGVTSPEVARCLTHLASLYMEEKRYAEAEPLLERAVNVWRSSANPDHIYAIITLACYGDLYRQTGRAAEARGMELRAKAVMAKYVVK